MNPTNHPFPEHSLVGACIKLAHSTFYDALASTAPARAVPTNPPRENLVNRVLDAMDNWFYRQNMKEREAYLGQAQDIFDLENRIHELERRPYF